MKQFKSWVLVFVDDKCTFKTNVQAFQIDDLGIRLLNKIYPQNSDIAMLSLIERVRINIDLPSIKAVSSCQNKSVAD